MLPAATKMADDSPTCHLPVHDELPERISATHRRTKSPVLVNDSLELEVQPAPSRPGDSANKVAREGVVSRLSEEEVSRESRMSRSRHLCSFKVRLGSSCWVSYRFISAPA